MPLWDLTGWDGMAFDNFGARGEVFLGMGKGQSWQAGVVAGFDGGKPGGFDGEPCGCMEVTDDEGTDTG